MKSTMTNHIILLGLLNVLFFFSCRQIGEPVITSYEPEFGEEATLITVLGSNFEDLTAINFDEEVAANFNPSFGTNDALLFRVPPDAPLGENMVEIITEHGKTSFPFRVTLQAPSIFDFYPKSANQGSEVTILGKNFFEPLEVLFFDSIAGNIKFAQADSIVVEVPAGVEKGRIKVKANGGSSITPELFFSTEEILVNDFDGNGIRNETTKWLFYGSIEQNAMDAIQSSMPDPVDGNFLKLSGFDSGGAWVGGTESHSNDPMVFDVFEIKSNINDTFVEMDINNNGNDDTHLIIVLAERNGSFNDFTETIAIDWDGWETINIPLNRFLDINGATPDPQKIRTIKMHLFNELGSNQKMEVNLDNIKFIQIL